MFIFGGWIPIDTSIKEVKEWKCTESLAVLGNLDKTPTWEEVDLATSNSYPGARAGHCSVVVNKRVYIWSGRDGYKKVDGGRAQARTLLLYPTHLLNSTRFRLATTTCSIWR